MSDLGAEKYSVEQIDWFTPTSVLSFREIHAGVQGRTVNDWTPEPQEFWLPFGAYEVDNARPVGIGLVRGTHELAKICGIAVSRDYSEEEVGAVLVHSLIEEAIDLEAKQLELINDGGQSWLRAVAKANGFTYNRSARTWVYED